MKSVNVQKREHEEWKEFLSSPDGKVSRTGSASGEYLENRLWFAFQAGLAAAKMIYEVSPAIAGNASVPVGVQSDEISILRTTCDCHIATIEAMQREIDELKLAGQPSGVGEPRVRELESLIIHMWVYSGYTKNGYQQMTTPQKALYDSLVGRSEEIAERDMPPTAAMLERAAREVGEGLREALERIAEISHHNLSDKQKCIHCIAKKALQDARYALAAPAPKLFANQFIVTKSIAEDGHTIKYFDTAGKQIFISDAPAPKPAPPKLTLHVYDETSHRYVEAQAFDGERIRNPAGVVSEPGWRWTGMAHHHAANWAGVDINGVDIAPEGVKIALVRRAAERKPPR